MSKRYQGGVLGVGFNPLQAPNAPTAVTATGGDTTASVAFTAPANVGGSAITGYTVQSNPGAVAATGSASPITVSGLTNGTAYTFNVWALNTYGPSPAGGPSGSVTPAAPIGIFGPVDQLKNNVSYITITTLGNSTDFGSLANSYGQRAGFSSSTRGLFCGGATTAGTLQSSIEYITISTSGSGSSFGSLSVTRSEASGFSNSTRGICNNGYDAAPSTNVMDYVTIASTGNATDFGDTQAAMYQPCATSSSTRGVIFGGRTAGGNINVIQYVTIATTGNTTDFGDLSNVWSYAAAVSSGTLAVQGAGYVTASFTVTNSLEYITIATTGNATDFGDLTIAKYNRDATCSTTRGVWAGGSDDSNVMDYITIATAGNATDFGDLATGRSGTRGNTNISSAHGGL